MLGLERIRREQEAFDRLLPELLEEHRGRFAVVHDGEVAGFYPSYAEAYEAALERFGCEAVFLVAEVEQSLRYEVSMSLKFELEFS